MTRRFIDDIRADIAANFADNVIGAITPALLRGVMNDVVDSCIQDECVIHTASPALAIPTTATPANLLVFTQTIGGDGQFLIPDALAGTITGSSVAGFTYSVSAQLTFQGNNNTPYEFQIARDGVIAGIMIGETGSGPADPVSVSLVSGDISAPSDAVWSLQVSSPEGNSSIDILAAYLAVVVQPTNNP